MSELDAKQKVLISLYLEYQKDIPNMSSIRHTDIGLEYDVFKVAVDKLFNEGFITDLIVTHGGQGLVPIHINLVNCRMTRLGIDYVESKLEIEKELSGEMKVKRVIEKVGRWGWDQFKDFGARVLTEMIKKYP
ncbi:YjcQ family protein [Paenibacillus sp. GM2]|uniref:YjcQ family protein n=1 Tax=Paenibacillus sp. GM2 TaxID=1622070 RepID=UPI000839B728|nr:YjcQ family protein [Paenibacillus sp. GM2]